MKRWVVIGGATAAVVLLVLGALVWSATGRERDRSADSLGSRSERTAVAQASEEETPAAAEENAADATGDLAGGSDVSASVEDQADGLSEAELDAIDDELAAIEQELSGLTMPGGEFGDIGDHLY